LLAYGVGFVLTALGYLLFRRFVRPTGLPAETTLIRSGSAAELVAYETVDADIGRIVAWGIGLVVGTLVLLLFVTVLFLGFVGRPLAVQIPPPGLAIGQTPARPLPPEPRL